MKERTSDDSTNADAIINLLTELGRRLFYCDSSDVHVHLVKIKTSI